MEKPASPSGTQSVHRALQILRLVSTHNRQGIRLSDLATQVQLSKPSVHRLLRELTETGLLMQAQNRLFHLGQFAYELGLMASAHYSLHQVCSPFVEQLAQETGDTVFLVMRSGFDSFCLDRQTGSYPIKVFSIEVGNRQPMGVGAGGLALLSFLTEAEREAALEELCDSLPQFNGLSVDTVKQMITETRQRGYSHISNHAVAGVTGFGMPILDRVGTPLAAISVTAINDRMTPEHQRQVIHLLDRCTQQAREALLTTRGSLPRNTRS
ncbi:IclR family transcriptional regulator [Comamonas thiooxydans]